jgi:hypothetical protein
MGTSPFQMVYGKACHLPVELEHKAYWAIKFLNFDSQLCGEKRLLQLNELDEFRLRAYENAKLSKERTTALHDAKIKDRDFKVGELALLYNTRLHLFAGKLKSRWSGPFEIVEVHPGGAISLKGYSGQPFKVNGHRLKKYFGQPYEAPEVLYFQKLVDTTDVLICDEIPSNFFRMDDGIITPTLKDTSVNTPVPVRIPQSNLRNKNKKKKVSVVWREKFNDLIAHLTCCCGENHFRPSTSDSDTEVTSLKPKWPDPG